MTEVPAFPEEVSEQSEASFVDNEKMVSDIESVKNLLAYGLPIDVRNAYNTTVDLGKVPYDECIPEQMEAQAHIKAARELFSLSYEKSVRYEVEEANRILTAYPGIILTEDNRTVISVIAVWHGDGSASLEFQTDL
jgi:hypothetical protein